MWVRAKGAVSRYSTGGAREPPELPRYSWRPKASRRSPAARRLRSTSGETPSVGEVAPDAPAVRSSTRTSTRGGNSAASRLVPLRSTEGRDGGAVAGVRRESSAARTPATSESTIAVSTNARRLTKATVPPDSRSEGAVLFSDIRLLRWCALGKPSPGRSLPRLRRRDDEADSGAMAGPDRRDVEHGWVAAGREYLVGRVGGISSGAFGVGRPR